MQDMPSNFSTCWHGSLNSRNSSAHRKGLPSWKWGCKGRPPHVPLQSLQSDDFLLDRFNIGDALLFKDFGVYFTKNALLKHCINLAF